MNKRNYPIFSVFGIELEYMIVNKNTLEIEPIADKVIKHMSGKIQNEFVSGEIAISNELALHVLELKTNGPKSSLDNFPQLFLEQINAINNALDKFNAKLMPTGAHPWLNPHLGIKLWPHGDRKIYDAYHRIFNAAGHGWGNLQSTHLNLPFANDKEFKQLHEAIRLLLPIIPALTASTPFLEGKYCGKIDGRLHHYGKNQIKIPSISGDIIPESVRSKSEYLNQILSPMYAEIAPFDIDKILQEEWLNSRGAIARFDRNAIEIRILDIQEAPAMDIAFIETIVATLKYLINKNLTVDVEPLSSKDLKLIYDAAVELGSHAKISHNDFLQALGLSPGEYQAKNIWEELYQRLEGPSGRTQVIMQQYFKYGNLSERIIEAVSNDSLHAVYNSLCDNLADNTFFTPAFKH